MRDVANKEGALIVPRYSVACVAIIFIRRVSVGFFVGFEVSTNISVARGHIRLRCARIVPHTPSSIIIGLLQKRSRCTESSLGGGFGSINRRWKNRTARRSSSRASFGSRRCSSLSQYSRKAM